MSLLPIYQVSNSLLAALKNSNQVLLHAPTGAGKSTALPLEILKSGVIEGRIILLEPRRIAARNVAYRLAEQYGEPIGETIGYRMRAESRISANTRLEVVTEGILTRMLQQDPLLEGVGLIILDEFHERSLQADLGLALLLDIQQGLREDLRILLMSATLDSKRLTSLFPDAPVIVSQGRSFPVERHFQRLNPHRPFAAEVASAVWQLMCSHSGSLLLFLPGIGEIQRTITELSARVTPDILLCPLYGALSIQSQQQAILPAPVGQRKIVLATNIAETSLTIEGIRLVVDSGLERIAQFNPRNGLTKLTKQQISQASMIQRAGRAGRLEPGVCWHLFSREQAERAPEHSQPEILHSDLSALWLSILQWGCQTPQQLSWLDYPPEMHIRAANKLLAQLGAVTSTARGQDNHRAYDLLSHKVTLTPKGQKMAAAGSEPRLSAILFYAQQTDDNALIKLAGLIIAILEDPPRSKGLSDIAIWLATPTDKWCHRASQICGLKVTGQDSRQLASHPALALLLAQGFADRIAKNRNNQSRFQLANGSGAQIEPQDSLADQAWVIAAQLWQGDYSADASIGLAVAVDIEQLEHHCPALFNQQAAVEWDEKRGTLIAWRRTLCGELIVRSERLANPSAKEITQALLYWVKNNGLQGFVWSDTALQLRIRLQLAAQWFPEMDLPAVDDESLLASLDEWLLPFLSGVKDLATLRAINLQQALTQRLDWQQKQWLETMLPTHYLTPTGNNVRIEYSLDKPPVIAVRMQEMYGESHNPTVAGGRIIVTLALLSPAMRPLQITQDLNAFWKGSYREIQKEMKGRYPKHLWPDDPVKTLPTQKTKKALDRRNESI